MKAKRMYNAQCTARPAGTLAKARMHKLLLMFALLLVATSAQADILFNGSTWYDYRDQSLKVDGNGTLLDPIVITTPEQLAQVAWLVNEQNNTFESKVIVLSADIDLTRESHGQPVVWQPIGLKNSFKGVFLGVDTREGSDNKRHSISGMYVDATITALNDVGNFGLFGRCDGFVGYLQLLDASVKAVATGSVWNKASVMAGLLCGRNENNDRLYVKEKNNTGALFLEPGFTHVEVKGTLDIDAADYTHIGGVCGSLLNGEITHSTATVTVKGSGVGNGIGGICGALGYVTFTNEMESHILDCAADVTFECTGSKSKYMGGIVGVMFSNTDVKGCYSTGSISKGLGNMTGGIVGLQEYKSTVMACISTVSFTDLTAEVGYLGGITGRLGASDGKTGTTIEGCVYGGHIDGSKAFNVGGICGELPIEDNEHIMYDLFLGTLKPSTLPGPHSGAIVGDTPKALATVVGCYYDKQLFSGNPVQGEQSVIYIKALSARELTSGKSSDVSFLPVDDTEEYGFTLRAGFYPTVFCNSHTPGYNQMLRNNIGSEPANSLIGSAVRGDNTLYQVGAWLASVPVDVRHGDSLDDFVSTLSVSTVDDSWKDIDGRTVSVFNNTQMPDAACIGIDETTATAKANGSCMLTINTDITVNGGSDWRPKPLKSSRQVWVNVTLDHVWDGSEATACAAGNGTAEDPFIVKNGAQLAYAVKNNKVGEFYKQICDITLNKPDFSGSRLDLSGDKNWEFNGDWNATYDGSGHFVHGLSITSISGHYALFGNITSKGSVTSLGVVSAYLSGACAGFSYNMDGKITDCLIHGTYLALPGVAIQDGHYELGRAGGICYAVGPHSQSAVVEDCVSALSSQSFLSDYTPFVSLSETSKGVVRNCLAVVPTPFADINFENRESFSAAGHSFITNCFWLKGYEAADSGYTLQEICQALGQRNQWQVTDGYFPMLKTFADTDYGKLLAIPVRTDEDYDPSASFLLGFSKQLTFEPGQAAWTSDGGAWIESDSDMGIISPIRASFVHGADTGNQRVRHVSGLFYLKAQFGQATVYIPIRTSDSSVSPGITFVDDNARQACLTAFDTNHDGNLSLAELKAVTNEQTLTAFQTVTAQRIKQFPEFRFFKSITTLTSQLNGLANLETVKLPYALQTLGSEAFAGCSVLKEVTLPSKLTALKPGAFYGSSVENILVDPFNTKFVSRDGVLFTTQKELVAYPNGRRSEEAVIEGTVKRIAEGAFYKVPGLRRLYFDTSDFTTVPRLAANAIVPDESSVGDAQTSMLDVYVSDATYDKVLFTKYQRDASWSAYDRAGKLHQYYPLKIDGSVKGVDGEGETCYFGTFCIGFDTELPQTLKPYIVEEARREEYKAFLTRKEQKIPATAAVIIAAREPGVYRLMPYYENLAPWPLYENRLVAVDRNGRWINQKSAAQGNIMTLSYAADGTTVGFFPEKGKSIEPYKAYLPYNTIGLDPAIAVNAHYDIVYNHFGPTAYVLWCSEHRRLSFCYTEDQVKVGDSYNGFEVTALWSDTQVTQTGSTAPAWNSVAENVTDVIIDQSFADVRPNSLNRWFANMRKITDIYGLEHLNTSQVTDMTSLFHDCIKLNELDLTNFDTRKVTLTPWMFYNCTSLKTITVGDNWNMDNVQKSHYMFLDDTSLVGENGTTYSKNNITHSYARPDRGASSPGYLWSVPDISLVDLADNSEPLTKYDGHLANVTYNRQLSAVHNDDGTWTPKAYTVCLPYNVTLATTVEEAPNAQLYRLIAVTDNYEYVFTNDFFFISAGIPYVAVINKGTFRLDAEKVRINATPSETEEFNVVHSDYNDYNSNQVGWWRGTFRDISNAEGSERHVFGLYSGKWKIIRNDTEAYRTGHITPFRAFYEPLEFIGNWVYSSKYIYTENGENDDLTMQDFPAETYDNDLPDYGDDDPSAIRPVIHTIDRDGTDRYFDLQGRLLRSASPLGSSKNGKPTKGVYIYNGKKVIK